MLNTRQHPQLGVELLRESHLETLNDFTSRMEKATEEAHSALTEQLTIWPNSMMPTAGKHHYTRLEIGYGSMVIT